MRHAFLMIFAPLCFAFFICCSDENAQVQAPVLIRKISTTYYGQPNTVAVFDFEYENGQLIKIADGFNHTEFTYLENKIATSKRYMNGNLTRSSDFFYEGSQLKSIVDSDGRRRNFTYNLEKLSAIEYQLLDEETWVTQQIETFSFDNALNAYGLTSEIIGGMGYSSMAAYNDGINPMRDMNPYFRLTASFEGIDAKSQNNMIHCEFFYPETTGPYVVHHYEITYYDAHFPKRIRKRDADGNLLSQTDIAYQQPMLN